MTKPKEPCTHPVVYAIGGGKLKCTRCGKILGEQKVVSKNLTNQPKEEGEE